MYIWYKNSILASIASLSGSILAVFAAWSIIDGELDILSGILAIAIGCGLVFLGSVISAWKEDKKKK